MASSEPPPYSPEVSAPKQRVLALLKRHPGASLHEIADALEISRTAALRHLVRLEGAKWVQREYRGQGVGRPRVCFRLVSSTQPLLPGAYVETALRALSFIERTQGRPAVVEMLQERAEELADRHAPRLAGRDLAGRLTELARIRDEDGYMAEVKRPRGPEAELLEHTCPILALADRYGEACDVERRLFQRLLGADVRVQHRLVAGQGVCRFLVRAASTGGG